MVKITNRMCMIRKKIDKIRKYNINDAILLLRELSTVKFVESVDVAINLNIDASKSDQNVRGAIVLPHGIGRSVRVAVFAQGKEAENAKIAGAELVGMDDLAKRIKSGEINFDVVISSPDAMHIVSQVGQILGPRGMMPNPKAGTVTSEISMAVKNAKTGQIYFRNDRYGIVHAAIGRLDFSTNKLMENIEALLVALKKAKPVRLKGIYFKKISISTTMGGGIVIDQTSLSVTLK